MKASLPLIIILFSFMSCSDSKELTQNRKMEPNNSKTTTCQLIEKEFINKGGKITEYKELYLRCSIQDYFIKICEGSVTKNQLKPYLNKGIEVEIEIKEGFLDHCNNNPAYAQSRTGTYIVINKIIK